MASKEEQTESCDSSSYESSESEEDRKLKAELLALREEKKLLKRNARRKKMLEEIAKEKKKLEELKGIEQYGKEYDTSSKKCKEKVDLDKGKKSKSEKLKKDGQKDKEYCTSTVEDATKVDQDKGKRSKSKKLKKIEKAGKECDIPTEECNTTADPDKGKETKSEDAVKSKKNPLIPHHEKENQEDKILDLSKVYEMVEQFISMDEYDKDLQNELTRTFPNYMEVLRAAKRDLTRSDCGIVVTGETSADKTSLINLIVQQKKLFVTSNLAATGKVCRIRDSDRMGLTLYKKDESLIKEETADNIKTLTKVVQRYTDVSECPAEYKDAYFVDVCLPVPILQGNVIIVDTPGIGETEELDNILLDFLPHAVSFIFIVNAQNAGGIHEDRLMKILRKIIENREKMPCFDPQDVLFLTNKWDGITDDSSDEDDDDDDTGDENPDEHSRKLTEREKTWNLIQAKLKKGWGQVSVEKIFRLSLKQIAKGMQTEFTEEYTRFQDVLQDTIERNQNKRGKFYFNFLVNFTQHAERGTLARIHMLGKSEDEQKKMIKKNREKIKEIQKDCQSKLVVLLEYKNEVVTKLADRLYMYISSEDGKWEILRRSEIMSESLSSLERVIPKRIEEGIKSWCGGDEFSKEMTVVNCRIESCVRDIHVQMETLETEMTGTHLAFVDHSFGIRAISYGMAFLLFGPLTLVVAVVIDSYWRLSHLSMGGLSHQKQKGLDRLKG